MPDVAIIDWVPPPGIWQQALYRFQLLEVSDERLGVPPARAAEPRTVAFAKGLRGTYVITDWILTDGSDVFTARLVGDPDFTTEFRFSVVFWPWPLLAGAGVVGLVWLGSSFFRGGEKREGQR